MNDAMKMWKTALLVLVGALLAAPATVLQAQDDEGTSRRDSIFLQGSDFDFLHTVSRRLRLSEEQRKGFGEIKQELDSARRSLRQSVAELRRRVAEAEEAEDAEAAMRRMRQMLAGVSQRGARLDAGAVKKAMALLTDEQRKTADKLFEIRRKLQEEARKKAAAKEQGDGDSSE